MMNNERKYKIPECIAKAIKLMGRECDPVHSCEVYKKEGCAHVDGYLCDMHTCNILREYKEAIKEN